MKLLDTSQWNALSTAEKVVVNTIYGEGDVLAAYFSRREEALIEGLVAKGLVTVEWGQAHEHGRARRGTVRIREEGWI